MEQSSETLMIVKTRASMTDDLVRFVKENHRYTVCARVLCQTSTGVYYESVCTLMCGMSACVCEQFSLALAQVPEVITLRKCMQRGGTRYGRSRTSSDMRHGVPQQ
jgi:hypothetical protein